MKRDKLTPIELDLLKDTNAFYNGGRQMSELNVYHCNEWHNEYTEFYIKSEADKVIAEKDKEIAELKADYREACDRLQTANLIKDEQKKKADVLLSTLKYLVMRDLIKDCPSKKTAAEIVKEYDI